MFKVENFNQIKIGDANLNIGCSSILFCLLFMLAYLTGDLSGKNQLEGFYLISSKIQFINIMITFIVTLIYNYPLQKCGIKWISLFRVTNLFILFTSFIDSILNFATFVTQIKTFDSYFICWFLCHLIYIAIMVKCFAFFRYYTDLSKL